MQNKGAGMMVHSLVHLPCKHKGIIPLSSPHDYNPSSGKGETGRSLRFVNEIPCLRGGGGGVPGDDTQGCPPSARHRVTQGCLCLLIHICRYAHTKKKEESTVRNSFLS